MVDTAVPAAQLRITCDPASLAFETTAELEPLSGTVGQDAAVEAIRLSAEMRHRRFNLFVQGPEGTGRHSSTFQILREVAATRPVPQDISRTSTNPTSRSRLACPRARVPG